VDVASLLDVDGDGISEIAVGEGWVGRTEVGVFASTAWLSGGTHDAVNALAVIETSSTNVDDYLGGHSVGGLDFNGDGLGDLLVGDRTGLSAGQTGVVDGVDIALGGTINLGDQITLIGYTGYEVGKTQGWIADMTNDGYDEVVVNASGNTPGIDASAGTVIVIDGDDLAPGAIAADAAPWFYKVHGTLGEGRLQGAEQSADFDGDGVPDLILTHAASPRDSVKNATFIHFGADVLAYSAANASDPSTDADNATMEFVSKNQGTQLGYHALGNDVDGDGDLDMVLTAPFGQSAGGYVAVFFNALGDGS
jgi:hypothetical protein